MSSCQVSPWEHLPLLRNYHTNLLCSRLVEKGHFPPTLWVLLKNKIKIIFIVKIDVKILEKLDERQNKDTKHKLNFLFNRCELLCYIAIKVSKCLFPILVLLKTSNTTCILPQVHRPHFEQ